MTRDELLTFMRARCDAMIVTIKDKNHDYTGGHPDPFFNFRAVELLDICDIETGLLTRITDKLMRVRSFVKLGLLKVKSESVVDTLVDASAYFLLLAAVVESKLRKSEKKAPIVATHQYSFETPITFGTGTGPMPATSHCRAEKRADNDWVMIFDSPSIDCARAHSLDELIDYVEGNYGKLTPLKEGKF